MPSERIAVETAEELMAGNADLMGDTLRQVGAQIRRLRNRKGYTLQRLSAETGVSTSMISMLERGLATPSIGTLVALSAALGTHMSELFNPGGMSGRSPVRRRTEQVEIETAPGVVRRLIHDDEDQGVEFVVNEYQPGTSSASTETHHPGREYGVVLGGSLVVELDGVQHELNTGDAITYSSMTPHRIRNTGRRKAWAVWVNLDSDTD